MVTRFGVSIGAVALTVVLPAVTLAAPTGHAVVRPAPVMQRASGSDRSANPGLGNFKVPFELNVRPNPPPNEQYTALQRWPGMPWRPNLLLYPNPCLMSSAAWGAPGLQATWDKELTMPGFTIGSLAGDGSNSLLSYPTHSTSIASLNNAGIGPSSSLSFQYGLPATICGQPTLIGP